MSKVAVVVVVTAGVGELDLEAGRGAYADREPDLVPDRAVVAVEQDCVAVRLGLAVVAHDLPRLPTLVGAR